MTALLACLLLAAAAVPPPPLAPVRLPALEARLEPDPAGGYVVRTSRGRLALGARGISLEPVLACPDERAKVEIRLRDADPHARAEAFDPLPGLSHYLLGKGSRTSVPGFGRVAYRDVYPGVDLVYRLAGNDVEFDLEIAAGVRRTAFDLAFAGVTGVAVEGTGDLLLDTGDGVIRQQAPLAWQWAGGRRQPVGSRFVKTGPRAARIVIGRRDPSRPLVIDPVLAYSTYLGGRGVDSGRDVAVDASGSYYLLGQTSSEDFPVRFAYQPALANTDGYSDLFVARFDPAGALVWATYLGGSGLETPGAIAVAADGSVVVAGYTDSIDYPVLGAVQPANAGRVDAVLTRLSADGSTLLYSTYLGGTGDDGITDLALDTAGRAVVVGATVSVDFPLVRPLQPDYGGGGYDAFVLELAADGASIAFSTFLGGSGYDWPNGVVLDASGSAYIAGETASTDFPLKDPLQPAYGGAAASAFVTKLDPGRTQLVYSTYLGGSGSTQNGDRARGIAVDAAGAAVVVGSTDSPDFPLKNPLPISLRKLTDAFITKIATDGRSILQSTLLGGSYFDGIYRAEVDAAGSIWVAGWTGSRDLPTADPLQRSNGSSGLGTYDLLIARIDSPVSALAFSTYLGGGGDDVPRGLTLTAAGDLVIAGWTDSADFPLAGQIQGDRNDRDAFLSRITDPTDSCGLRSAAVLNGPARICSTDGTTQIAADPSAPGTCTSWHYQWYEDGRPIAGAIAAVLDLAGPKDPEVYRYTLETTCDAPATCTARSFGVDVEIEGPRPRILVDGSPTYCAGGFLLLNASASTGYGCNDLTFQWLDGGAVIPGATSSFYQTPDTLPPGSHSYSVEVGCATSLACSARSDPVAVEIVVGPGAIGGLTAVRRGDGAHFEWGRDPAAAGGYRLYRTADAALAGAARGGTPAVTLVAGTATVDATSADDPGVVSLPPSAYYQVLGLCVDGKFEGPN